MSIDAQRWSNRNDPGGHPVNGELALGEQADDEVVLGFTAGGDEEVDNVRRLPGMKLASEVSSTAAVGFGLWSTTRASCPSTASRVARIEPTRPALQRDAVEALPLKL
jgi:hypothetical protein